MQLARHIYHIDMSGILWQCTMKPWSHTIYLIITLHDSPITTSRMESEISHITKTSHVWYCGVSTCPVQIAHQHSRQIHHSHCIMCVFAVTLTLFFWKESMTWFHSQCNQSKAKKRVVGSSNPLWNVLISYLSNWIICPQRRNSSQLASSPQLNF